jgi:hypothetical protein
VIRRLGERGGAPQLEDRRDSHSSSLYPPPRPSSLPLPELDRAITFLGSFLEKQARLGKAATLVLQLELLSLRVKRTGASAAPSAAGAASSASSAEDVTSTLDAIKRDLAAAKEALDALPDGEDPTVPGTYYRVASEYYKLRGPAHLFFEHALLYLGHANVEALAPEARRAMATDIAIAALVGEGVYNFGEVNSQPVLSALVGSPQAWLRDLLAAFQGGDLTAFHAVIAANRAAFNAEPALAACAGAIQEKITLLAYMEMAARRPGESKRAWTRGGRESPFSPLHPPHSHPLVSPPFPPSPPFPLLLLRSDGPVDRLRGRCAGDARPAVDG